MSNAQKARITKWNIRVHSGTRTHYLAYYSGVLTDCAFEVKVLKIQFSSYREVKKTQSIRGQGRHLFSDRRENTYEIDWRRCCLASWQVSSKSVPWFQRRSRKSLSKSEVGRPSLFPDRPKKNTNLVKDMEFLVPLKFRKIPFSGFSEEVENVSVNQGLRWPSIFNFRLVRLYKLVRGRWVLTSCQVLSNSIQQF